ncbi:MAG: diguanylate cyclase [Blastocatellia bacterium]
MKILIVDDDSNSRLVLAKTLQHFGHEVIVAPDGERAWQMYDAEPYQFVITDFRMPELNGPGLCRRIRKSKNHDYTYIILLTTDDNRDDLLEGLDAGADGLLRKPFDRAELEARIRAGERILQLEKSLQEKTEQNKEINRRMRWHIQREQVLNQLLRSLNESPDLNARLSSVARQLQTLFQTSRAFVLLFDTEKKVQEVAGEYTAPGIRPLGSHQFPVELSEISAAYASHGVQAIDDLLNQHHNLPDYQFRKLAVHFEVRALMTVPVLYHGNWLGTIGVHHCEGPRQWKEEEVSLLSEIAQPMAMAISNARLYQQVQEQAVRDALTGLYNRRHFDQVLHAELERAQRYGHALSLVMLDLDHLKLINDQFGHQAGDTAIREIGRTLGRLHRKIDTVARYGGEEFSAILSHVPPKGALIAAESWRAAINEIRLETGWQLSASVGVAIYQKDGTTAERLIKAADDALYQAKRKGRNRVCLAGETEDAASA